jgi:hypothetical protein
MGKNLTFRIWFYFRQGWSVYFAFVFAAINTLVTTYYLAIQKAPFLQEIFPTFISYVLIVASLAIPILAGVGYIHMKKSTAFKAEAAVGYESNPYVVRTFNDVELLLRLNLNLVNLLLLDYAKNDVSNEKLDDLIKLKNEIETYFSKREDDKQIDLALFRKFSNSQ